MIRVGIFGLGRMGLPYFTIANSQPDVEVVGECNRQDLFAAVAIFFRRIKIIRTGKPDVIITTGSLPIAIVSLAAKLFGEKFVPEPRGNQAGLVVKRIQEYLIELFNLAN